MKITLFKNMSSKVELFDNEGADYLTIKGKEIALANFVVGKFDKPHEPLLTDYIRLSIDGKEFESCGDTILISSTKLKDSIKDPTYCYTNTDYLIEHLQTNKNLYRKPYWVIIKSQTGHSFRAYNCRFVQTEIMTDFPKMTKIYIDDDILYVHRANINIIDSKLIK